MKKKYDAKHQPLIKEFEDDLNLRFDFARSICVDVAAVTFNFNLYKWLMLSICLEASKDHIHLSRRIGYRVFDVVDLVERNMREDLGAPLSMSDIYKYSVTTDALNFVISSKTQKTMNSTGYEPLKMGCGLPMVLYMATIASRDLNHPISHKTQALVDTLIGEMTSKAESGRRDQKQLRDQT